MRKQSHCPAHIPPRNASVKEHQTKTEGSLRSSFHAPPFLRCSSQALRLHPYRPLTDRSKSRGRHETPRGALLKPPLVSPHLTSRPPRTRHGAQETSLASPEPSRPGPVGSPSTIKTGTGALTTSKLGNRGPGPSGLRKGRPWCSACVNGETKARGTWSRPPLDLPWLTQGRFFPPIGTRSSQADRAAPHKEYDFLSYLENRQIPGMKNFERINAVTFPKGTAGGGLR